MDDPAMETRSILAAVRPTFRAVVLTLVPESSRLETIGWRSLETIVEGVLQSRPAGLQRQLQLFLRLIEWAPVFRYGRTFTRLDERQRGAVLSYLQDHRMERVRAGFWGLRTLVLMGYYGRPEAAEAVGYAPHADGWDVLERDAGAR